MGQRGRAPVGRKLNGFGPDDTTGKGARSGVLCALGAFVIWGVSPLYFAMMDDVPAFEVVAHRILWALPAIAAYAALTGRWAGVRQVAREPRTLALTALSASAIAVNWVVFIVAIQEGQTAQASFGYYIYPIIAVILGAIVFRERIGRLQRIAAALATFGVLCIAVEQGTPPWLALVVAGTFAAYGTIRKSSPVGPMEGVVWELALAAPFLMLYLAWIGGGVFGTDWGVSLWLVGGSLFTGIPLVMYVEAARRLAFSTVGVLFYINPTLQFVCALALGEALSLPVLGAFGIIWAGVALYCTDLMRRSA